MLQGRGPRRGLERCAGPSLSSRLNYKQVKYTHFALSTHPSVVYGSRMVSHKVLTHAFVRRPRLKGGEASQAPRPLLSETSPDAQGFFPSGVKTELMEGFCAPPVRGDDVQGPVGEGGNPAEGLESASRMPLPGGHRWGLPSHAPLPLCAPVCGSVTSGPQPFSLSHLWSLQSLECERPGLRSRPRLPRGWG